MRRKGFSTVLLLLAACFTFSFMQGFATNPEGGKDKKGDEGKSRQIVERMFSANNVNFNRDVGQTIFSFRVMEGDSIRLSCPDCGPLLTGDKKNEGQLSLTLKIKDETKEIQPDMFDRWIGLGDLKGNLELIFEVTEGGKKVADVAQLRVFRKFDEE